MSASALQTRLFRQLIAIDEAGSVRRAAEMLSLTQPALSKSMQEFERRLGVELLYRGRSGAALTPPARDIVEKGRQILLLTEEIERDLSQWPQTKTGLVRLGAGSGSLPFLMRLVVHPFLAEYPDVDVEVYSRDPRELAKMIASGEIDVLVAVDETLEDTDLLIRRPLRREKVTFFARADHPLVGRPSCSYEDIAAYRVASPFFTANLLDWFEARRSRDLPRENHLVCHDYSVLCDAMMRGDCVGVGTTQMLGYLQENYDLQELTVPDFTMRVLVHCIYRKVHEFSRSKGALIRMIEDKMKNIG